MIPSVKWKGVSGVYEIRNLENGKKYIGSSVNLYRREISHFGALARGNHYSRHLQSAYNKYGKASFLFVPILLCEPFEVLRYEQYMIDLLKPQYNKSSVAGSTIGVPCSLDKRMKISMAKRGVKHGPMSMENRQKISMAQMGNKYNLGKKRPPEVVEKIRQSNLGRKHPFRPKSPEHRRKISEALKGMVIPVDVREKMRVAARKRWEKHSKTKSAVNKVYPE